MQAARRVSWITSALTGLWLGGLGGVAQDHWEVESADLLGVTSGKGLLVAVDSEGGTRLSRDGVVWFRCGRVTDQSLRAVAHGQGKFVAVGDYGSVVTSPDGLAWEAQVSGTDVHLQGVAYARGRFVAVGEAGTVLTSEDGRDWRLRRSDPNTRNVLQGVAADAVGFVAVQRQGGVPDGGRILTSPDGFDWTVRLSAAVGFNRVVRGTVDWVAVGVRRNPGTGALLGVVSRSLDGVVWSQPQTVVGSGELTDVAYTGTRFVAVGTGGVIATSEDGLGWVVRSSGTTADLLAVASGEEGVVATGQGGTVLGSSEGIAWRTRQSGLEVNLSSVVWARGAYVAVGDGGRIVVSRNGVDWASRASGVANRLSGIGFGAGRFVAVGDTGTVLASPFEPADGIELSMPEPTPVGGVRFRVLGRAEGPVGVERTLDLKSWSEIRLFGAGELPGSVIDGAGSVDAVGLRSYRARRAPGR